MCFVLCRHCQHKSVQNVIRSIVFMSTLSTKVCTECNKFNCIYVNTVDTCIFTCFFYTNSLKKSRKGIPEIPWQLPCYTSHFRCRLCKWDGCQVPNEVDQGALEALHKAAENYMVSLMEDENLLAIHQLCSPGISSLHVEYGESPNGWT